MTRHTVTLIPGDGIGPEVAAAAVRVLDAGDCLTRDVGGSAGTTQFTEAVVAAIEAD